MSANVVEVLVRSTDETRGGFDSARTGARGTAGSMRELAAAQDKAAEAEREFRAAQAEQNEALARQEELARSGTASADELAAAQDRVTQASLASMDAQIKLGAADDRVAGAQRAQAVTAGESAAKTQASGGIMAAAGAKMKMALLGVGIGMGLAVKGAADFQQQTTKLVTSAGESARNLGMVQHGILSLSSATNTSTAELAKGMYTVESAGFHGAAGLAVLKAAAQGAQAEGADLGEVANAVTSGLNAYGMKAKDATAFTDMMVAAVGQGKMTMQDLASSMSAVLPIAASAHISFAQVGGAIATMTSQGMSARQASQDLANSIRALLNPNSVAVNEMNQFGISSTDVANKLGERGLTGTIGYLAGAVASKMGPAGDVILSAFNKSRTAAADADTMLKNLPPDIAGVAKAYLDGTISTKQWTSDLKAMPPLQANLARQFAAMADKAHGFNSLVTSGSPQAQTFAAALGKMMGGATGLNTALMLTGSHAATFSANVRAVGDAAKGAGGNVAGWGTIQKETNFQLGSAEKAVKAMGISLGMALLPGVTAILGPLTSMLGFIASNKDAAYAFAAVVGGVLAGALGVKLAGALSTLKGGITAVVEAGSSIPSLISSVAGFASAVVSGLASAVAATGAWIAEHAAATAMFIAQNLAQAASASAAFVAENAATLGLGAAIAALVAVIIYLAMHWRQVWGDIKRVAVDAWHFIDDDMIRPLQRGIAALVSWIGQHWRLLAVILATVLLGPVGGLVAFLATHWSTVVRDVSSMASKVVGFFRRLPGEIVSALGDLAGMLYQAGVNAIGGLIHGVASMLGAAVSAVGNVGHTIANAITHPFGIHFSEPSEATQMIKAGRNIPGGLAKGVLAGMPDLTGVMARAAALTAPRGGFALAGAGGGPGRLEVTLRMGPGSLLKAMQAEVRYAGGDPLMFQKKVAFR